MITVRKPTPQEAEQMKSLPTWGCEVSEFDWCYNDTETCLLIKGQVKVTYDGGEAEFGAGDLVQFAKGLQCRWIVTEDVEKYYKFG
jgi:hypothetical protein